MRFGTAKEGIHEDLTRVKSANGEAIEPGGSLGEKEFLG